MIVRIFWPAADDQWFILLVPKTLGTAHEILANHNQQPITWSRRIEGQDVEGVYLDDPRFNFRSRLRTEGPTVVFTAEVENTSTEALDGTWLFTFLAPHGAPDFLDPEGERTFFSLAGTPTALASVAWPVSTRGNVAVYPASSARRDLPRMLVDIDALADATPDEGWMLAMNSTGDAYIGYASPNPLFLFRNKDISSLHVAPLMGDIPPGESGKVEMHAFFGQGNLEAAIARARHHASRLSASHQ